MRLDSLTFAPHLATLEPPRLAWRLWGCLWSAFGSAWAGKVALYDMRELPSACNTASQSYGGDREKASCLIFSEDWFCHRCVYTP